MKKLFLLLFLFAFITNGMTRVPYYQPFVQSVTKGLVPGHSTVDKFGVNLDIDEASTPEPIWEYGGTYEFSVTDDIMYISSSVDTDTHEIKIQGLNLSGELINQTIELQGQTRLTIETKLWRAFRMENEGIRNVDGKIYLYAGIEETVGVPDGDSVVKAMIDNGNNQTLMAIYTIPKGKIGFLYKGEIGLQFTGSVGAGTNYIRASYRSRRYGKIFKIKKMISCMTTASSNFQDYRSFPDLIPSLTDIKICVCEVSADNMGAWATFDILLVDESEFKDDYLKAIGQPGY